MGRKSKLTPEQWAEVDRRLIEGEAVRAVARDFPISEAAIRERLVKLGKTATVQEVARKIVDAENSLATLPIAAQVSAHNLAAKLRSISSSLAAGAELQAANFHRLSALAKTELAKVDDDDPMSTAESLKSSMALTKAANEAAATPIGLLSANKGANLHEPDDIPKGLEHFYGGK